MTGITLFGGTVNRAKCEQYIGHLRRVLPRVIEVKGEATGYYDTYYMYNMYMLVFA